MQFALTFLNTFVGKVVMILTLPSFKIIFLIFFDCGTLIQVSGVMNEKYPFTFNKLVAFSMKNK